MDVNNDGNKDLFVTNSHPNDRIGRSEAVGWKQPNGLFLNEGRGRFRDAAAESGLAGTSAVHRGCGAGDFDGDGRVDIVVLVLGERAELWQQTGPAAGSWLMLNLVGTRATATASAHASRSAIKRAP